VTGDWWMTFGKDKYTDTWKFFMSGEFISMLTLFKYTSLL
jgi:hypothetical protein